jgi:hypothetical protein
MRKCTWVAGFGAVVLVWLVAGSDAGAGDKKKGGKPPSPEQIMELVEKLATPGPHHKALEPLVGEFTCKVKVYMDPSKPPSESKGTIARKWILGRRFLQERVDGTAMGKPFVGMGWVGYDNSKKKYTVAWIDTMTTAIMTMNGTYDPDTKTFTYTGEEDSPFFGGRVKTRDVLRIDDADSHTLEMYRQPKGAPEFKMMEITCKRASKRIK